MLGVKGGLFVRHNPRQQKSWLKCAFHISQWKVLHRASCENPPKLWNTLSLQKALRGPKHPYYPSAHHGNRLILQELHRTIDMNTARHVNGRIKQSSKPNSVPTSHFSLEHQTSTVATHEFLKLPARGWCTASWLTTVKHILLFSH